MRRQLISLQHAAARIGFTVHALRRWIRLRRLPYHRVGARIMLDEGDLERFIDECRVPAREESLLQNRR
jgi:excisionase family DNA binding protein